MRPRWPTSHEDPLDYFCRGRSHYTKGSDLAPGAQSASEHGHGHWPIPCPNPVESEDTNYHETSGTHPWKNTIFQAMSTSQWAATTLWLGSYSQKCTKYGEGSDSFQGGIHHLQNGDVDAALQAWTRVRGHLMRERSRHSPFHYRALAVLCSHIALALGRQLDRHPTRTRGVEPRQIKQHGMRPDIFPNRKAPSGFFQKAVEYHLEHLTVNAGKPLQVEKGRKRVPDVAVTLLPSPVPAICDEGVKAVSPTPDKGPHPEHAPLVGMAVEERVAEQHDHMAVIDAINEQLKEAKRLGQCIEQAHLLGQLGDAHHAAGDLDGAVQAHKQMLAMGTRSGIPALQCQAHAKIGSDLYAQRKYRKAIDEHETALGLSMSADVVELQHHCYLLLASDYHCQAENKVRAPPQDEELDLIFKAQVKATFESTTRPSKRASTERKPVKPRARRPKPLTVAELGVHQLSEAQQHEAKRLFELLDVNKSKELDTAEAKTLRVVPTELEPDEVWDLLDADSSGFVELREWSVFLGKVKAAKVKALQREEHYPEGTAKRLAHRHMESFLEHIQHCVDHPEAQEARRKLVEAKKTREEEQGGRFKGSFLGRNKGQGNVGMHGSNARGGVNSNIDQAALLKGGTTAWSLNPAEEAMAKRLFKGLDDDNSRCLDPRELYEHFMDRGMVEALDTNGDGVVDLQEWMRYMRQLKREMWDMISTSDRYKSEDLKIQVAATKKAYGNRVLTLGKNAMRLESSSPSRSSTQKVPSAQEMRKRMTIDIPTRS